MPKSYLTAMDRNDSPTRLAGLCRKSAFLVADPDAALRLLKIALRLDDLAADIAVINQSSIHADWPMMSVDNISHHLSIH